jgi:hypothetical protein
MLADVRWLVLILKQFRELYGFNDLSNQALISRRFPLDSTIPYFCSL